ncbi:MULTISPECIES: hypothetical protein [Pseudomonas]|uniref:Uncharacterized protein n=1 Tax=Pseudomonas fluorescens TaxID=294 RepID=A0A161Z6X7_PSEFL|nr:MULTISPECIES: hypothetical protein [Pseudomonas]KZN19327.1 hypothetical protein A1D17_25370 [Pseudomonas fluorescens]
MTSFRMANTVLSILLFSSIAFGVVAKDADKLNASDRKILLYVGNSPCNNGEVTTYGMHKGCAAKEIGYTIDDASAAPAANYIEVFAGNDVENNKMVSKDSNHKNGSTESIGYLSKNPIPHGVKIYTGDEPCNMGEATISTRHKGCNAVFLGYALPLQ